MRINTNPNDSHYGFSGEIIRAKAYEIWKAQGEKEGNAQGDWYAAIEALKLERKLRRRNFGLEILKATGTITAVLGLIFVYFNFIQGEKRLVTERFSTAINLLANEQSEVVRVGGIYALEDIAYDSPRDYYWTVMEVFSSYIRQETSMPNIFKEKLEVDNEWNTRIKELENERKKAVRSIDVITALQVITRRETPRNIDVITALQVITGRETPKSFETKRLDLNNIFLLGSYLVDANLERAELGGIYLYKSNLLGANLKEANLNGARLVLTRLREADFSHATLHGTKLREALLYEAKLNDTELYGADFTEAYLEKAKFKDANFYGATLKKANIRGANFLDAKNLTPKKIVSACYWEEATYKSGQENDNYIDSLRREKSLNPIPKSECDNYWTEKEINERLEGIPGIDLI